MGKEGRCQGFEVNEFFTPYCVEPFGDGHFERGAEGFAHDGVVCSCNFYLFNVSALVVGWVREVIVSLDHWHLESVRCLDGKDFFVEGLTQECLNVIIELT